MPEKSPVIFHFEHMRRARDRAADHYKAVSVLQQSLEQELLDRLQVVQTPFKNVLVYGAGNLHTIDKLKRRYPEAHQVLVDFSTPMLASDKAQMSVADVSTVDFICSDMVPIPLPNGSVDLVFSNLYMAHCDQVVNLLDEWMRVLRPGGCLHFSGLGADTFKELRQAWRVADPNDAHHVIEFADMHDLGDALVQAGFSEPVMDCEMFTLTYSTAATMLDDLRGNGIKNYFAGRKTGLTGRKQWQKFQSALPTSDDQQRYLLTVEAVLGQAWKPLNPRQQQRDDGSVSIPLETLFGDASPGR